MSEQRIKALEDGIISLRKDMSTLALTHSNLDKSLTALVVKLDAHFKEEEQLEKTIRNIDNNITNIKIHIAESPLQQHKDMKDVVDPLWEIVRKFDTRIHTSSDEIKRDIKADIIAHLRLAWGGIILISLLATYIYIDDQTLYKGAIVEVRKDIRVIANKIEDRHRARIQQ